MSPLSFLYGDEPQKELRPTVALPTPLPDGLLYAVSLARYDASDKTVELKKPRYRETVKTYLVGIPDYKDGKLVSVHNEERSQMAQEFSTMAISKTSVQQIKAYKLDGTKLKSSEIIARLEKESTVLVSPGLELIKDPFFRNILREDMLIIEDPTIDPEIKAMEEMTGNTFESRITSEIKR